MWKKEKNISFNFKVWKGKKSEDSVYNKKENFRNGERRGFFSLHILDKSLLRYLKDLYFDRICL